MYLLDINEALIPSTHPNVAHVLDISEALVQPSHPNVPYFSIYPHVTTPGGRHLGAASELLLQYILAIFVPYMSRTMAHL